MITTQQINAIQTRADFVAFARALNNDLRNNPQSWNNKELEQYIEALASWAEDMDGYYLNNGEPAPEKPDWKMVANMLLAAKMYE